jgi:hypothetical protein
MDFKIPDPINRNCENGASALIVDIRGSAELVRTKSYSDSTENYNEALKQHTGFMLEMFKLLFARISSLSLGDEFSFNDTGDGCLCVFWNEKHSLTCIKIASVIHQHLLSQEYLHRNKVEFGIGLHTGGCLIYRMALPIRRDFVFGIVPNTAARVEKFTKNLRDSEKKAENNPRMLFTGNFKDNLLRCLTKELRPNITREIVPVSTFRLSINDGKTEGHILYTISSNLIKEFAEQ